MNDGEIDRLNDTLRPLLLVVVARTGRIFLHRLGKDGKLGDELTPFEDIEEAKAWWARGGRRE